MANERPPSKPRVPPASAQSKLAVTTAPTTQALTPARALLAASRANPNLQIVLHWVTEIVILCFTWVAALHHDIPVWGAVVGSAVIGGWVPASMVLQVLARGAQPPGQGGTPGVTIPPPVTLALLALASTIGSHAGSEHVGAHVTHGATS